MTSFHHPSPVREAFIQKELTAGAALKERISVECTGAIIGALDLILRSLGGGGKILLCGNGGSAADAQHIAAEFVVRLNPAVRRPGIPAIALTTDSSMLTAAANDLGYENVFARAVEALGRPGDALIAISTSGRSPSIHRALEAARARSVGTIGLLGRDGGSCAGLADIAIVVPSDDTQRIQEAHITIGHILCALVERELYG
ncbi:MAG: D-sedoheptulose 7-phosphate isomerase [Bacteroidota bacterium]